MKRAALYIRVSTEEQTLHGYSLEAQRETLTEYAKSREMAIVGYYQDEGISARKRYTKRPALLRLLRDVEAGKVDTVVFIKLDRWFRNVGDYYEVQRILDAHKVTWQAALEDYETETAAGRLKVNIMLAVAQDEADRTSERIKFVFESKVRRGEAITGKLPPGYRIEGKRVVHDPAKADMIRDMFRYYAEHGSKHGACVYMFQTYGYKIDRHYFSHMLSNPLYKGEYHGVPDYCEPLIEPELFDRLQTAPKARLNQTRRVYLFSGLVRCAECGSVMAGRYNTGHIYYRCNRYSNYQDCPHKKMIREDELERWLLENLVGEIRAYLTEYQSKRGVRQKRVAMERATIQRKLARLKDLYVNEIIDLDAYRRDYEHYMARLSELPEEEEPATNVETLMTLLKNGFRASYAEMDRERRRGFWRGVLGHIQVDAAQHITLSFTR